MKEQRIDLYAWKPDDPRGGPHQGGPEPSKSFIANPSEVEGVSWYFFLIQSFLAFPDPDLMDPFFKHTHLL